MTTFHRCSEDNKWWWHWHPRCIILRGKTLSLKRGKTWVTTIVVSGFPTTYHLCPGCWAEHHRTKQKSVAVYVKRVVLPKKIINKTTKIEAEAPMYVERPLLPTVTRNPVTQVLVRRDARYGFYGF